MVSNKQTIASQLESLAVNQLPSPFNEKLTSIMKIVGELQTEAAAIGVNRKFTPDGRFLGDFGELIAKVNFGLTLHGKQTEGEDAVCEISGKTVEVKLRSNSSLIWVKKIPGLLLVIHLSPKSLRWGVVCNGSGKDLLADAKWNENHKHYETNISKLLKAQALHPENSIKQIK